MARLFTSYFEETTPTDEFTFSDTRADRCDECSERVPDGARMNKVKLVTPPKQITFQWYDDLEISRRLCDKCYLRERLEGNI